MPSIIFINRVYPPASGATGEMLRDIAEAGFVDITEPDVGASPKIAFVMAARP